MILPIIDQNEFICEVTTNNLIDTNNSHFLTASAGSSSMFGKFTLIYAIKRKLKYLRLNMDNTEEFVKELKMIKYIYFTF